MEEGGGDGGKMEVEVWKQQQAEIREEKRVIQLKVSSLSWWCVHRLEEEFQFQRGSECSGQALKEMEQICYVAFRIRNPAWFHIMSVRPSVLRHSVRRHSMWTWDVQDFIPKKLLRFNPAGGADATFWMRVVPPTVGWAPERLQHGGPAARQMWLLRGEKETFL